MADLWDRVLGLDNLLDAFRKAAQGKAQRVEVRAFRGDLHANLRRLDAGLAGGRFPFGPYRQFLVRDPKPRYIQVAPFEQRIVHHALINVIGPVLDRSLIDQTYACRTGKGQHAALDRARHWARRFPWYLKMDIAKFYDSIDHAVLRGIVAQRFAEAQVLDCLDRVIGSYATAPGRGLPIGNLTSQHFGNSYLDGFDHWIKQTAGRRAYLRYMDDMLVFGESAADLRGVRDGAAQWLQDERALRLKHDGEINRTTLGIPFLGWVLRADGERLHPRCAQRFRRKAKRLRRDFDRGEINDRELQDRGVALHAAIRWGPTKGLRRAVALCQASPRGYA